MNGFAETQHEALEIMGHVAKNAIPALNVRLKDLCRYVQHNAALQSEWERMCSATSLLIINVSENGISMLAKNTKVALSFIGRSKKILKKVTRNRIDVRKM